MPYIRERMHVSTFCDFMAIDPARFVDVEVRNQQVILVLTEEDDMAQTSGVIPQLTQSGKRIGGKKAKGRK